MCISRLCTATWLRRPLCNTWAIGIIVRLITPSVKFGYLVCAVTVHLLLFLFEGHGNKEYVRALACVRVYVPVRVI